MSDTHCVSNDALHLKVSVVPSGVFHHSFHVCLQVCSCVHSWTSGDTNDNWSWSSAHVGNFAQETTQKQHAAHASCMHTHIQTESAPCHSTHVAGAWCRMLAPVIGIMGPCPDTDPKNIQQPSHCPERTGCAASSRPSRNQHPNRKRWAVNNSWPMCFVRRSAGLLPGGSAHWRGPSPHNNLDPETAGVQVPHIAYSGEHP